MSNIDNIIMKNLISMGLVENDGEIQSTYKTPDNNYTIELKRANRLSFLSEYSDSSYMCNINIKSIFGTSILNIKCTELEIQLLLDQFYNLLEYNIGNNIYHYFNPIDTNCIPTLVKLIQKDKYIITDNYYPNNPEYILEFYNIYNYREIKRLSINIDKNNIENLLELMYYTFLI